MVGSGKCVDDNDVAEVVAGLGPGPNVGGEFVGGAEAVGNALGFLCGAVGYPVVASPDTWRVEHDNVGLGQGVYQVAD